MNVKLQEDIIFKVSGNANNCAIISQKHTEYNIENQAAVACSYTLRNAFGY